jgi:hypothetical protein
MKKKKQKPIIFEDITPSDSLPKHMVDRIDRTVAIRLSQGKSNDRDARIKRAVEYLKRHPE